MNPLLISSLVCAALGFGSAWQVQSYRMDAYKLEIQNERLAIEQSSHERLAEAAAKVEAAQDAARVATDRVRRDVASAAAAGNGLRDTLSSAVRSAHTDLQTCSGQVDALGELLTASTDLARRMAAEADSWAIQAVTLQEAWPK